MNTCERCGAATRNKHFCGQKCSALAFADFNRGRAKPVVLREMRDCEICGTPTKNKRACSPQCHNAALRLTGKGTWFNAESGGKGPKCPAWRGDDIGYEAAHGRVVAIHGPASEHSCEFCSEPAKEWAYDHQDINEKQDKDGPYSPDPARYMPLCKKCHKAFDNAARLANESNRTARDSPRNNVGT